MEWMDLFCQSISCTVYFKQQVQSQLGQQFAEQTGMRLDLFVLVPPFEGTEIYYDQNDIAYLNTDLVAADANGYPVTIAWQCVGHGKVLPSDPDLQSNNSVLQAWWHELPVEELKSKYATPRNTPWPISVEFPFEPNDYSFEVKWEVFAWPDVWLEVETNHPVFPQSNALLLDELVNVWEQWNQAARTGKGIGVIHNLGTQQRVISPNTLLINIDFGSASPKALVEMFNALQKVAKKLEIRWVACRSFK